MLVNYHKFTNCYILNENSLICVRCFACKNDFSFLYFRDFLVLLVHLAHLDPQDL